jgi:uncharacterized GH25 family protein
MTTIHSPLSLLKRCGLLVSLLTLSTVSLFAHDMWIEPTAFLPDAGRIIGLRLRVGQDFLGDPLPYNSALIDQFIGVDSTGRKPVVGHDGNDPAGLIRVAGAGMLIIGYNSNPSPVVLPAGKFNQYLQEEGLEAIAELRKSRNQTNSDAREVFSRCAKSLLFSGTPADNQSDRALGFTLELIAKKNPYALRAGDDLPVDLVYQGHPLAGVLVVAMNRQNPAAKIMARSDKNGRVTFRLPQSGIWLVKAVHMIPAAAGSNADWASFWASLTFELKTSTTGVAAR